MKVCLFAPNYNRGSGVTTVVRNLYHALSGFRDLELFCADARAWVNEGAEDRQWIPRTHYLEVPLYSNGLFEASTAWLKFRHWVSATRVDVVHVHHRRLMPLARFVAATTSAKTLYTAHDIYPPNELFKLVTRGPATAISQDVATNLEKTTHFKPIYGTGNPYPFKPTLDQQLEGDYINTVICIARFDPVKGHRNLIESWKMLSEQGMKKRLVLVGAGGSIEQQLRSQVREHNLESSVEFPGLVSDVASQLRQSLYSVLPSRHEGLGMVVLESADEGRPTLMTNVPGLRDCLPTISALPNGIPFGDTAALASAMAKWLKDPEETLRMGRSMRLELITKFDSSVVGNKYVSIYQSLSRNT